MTRFIVALGAVYALFNVACGAAHTIAPAAGTSGPYVHLGKDGQTARSGLAKPDIGWPPQDVLAQDTCADEKARVEADLGVTSTACPQLQVMPVAAVADADEPIRQGPGFDVQCYEVGHALLIVEYAQTTVHCSHVTGLAVFHKAEKQP